MSEPSPNPLTFLERTAIQMQYAVPLIRDLQKILGEQVVNDALAERTRMRAEEAGRDATPATDLTRLAAGTAQFAAGDALEFEIVESSAERFDMNVTRCGYAAMMEGLGARDIGHLLICNLDYEGAARIGTDLTRTGTCMQGDSFCDFRYRRRA